MQTTKTTPRTTKPGRHCVLIFNDEKTPLNFVADVLTQIFNHPSADAAGLAAQIHRSGKGRIGSYTLEVAETKSEMVMRAAKAHGFPLTCQTVSA